MSIGNSSRRPANISNISTYLLKFEKKPKFLVGPTIDRPGPMLLMVAATAVKLVVISLPSKDTRKSDRPNTIIKVMKYTLTERRTS